MFSWLRTPLYDKVTDGDGGGDGSVLIDPGAPFELDHEAPAPKPEVKVADPNALRLTALEEEIKTLRASNKDLTASERHWAALAQRRIDTAAEPQEVAAPAAPTPIKTRSPEQLLDGIATRGLEELTDGEDGLVTKAQLRQLLAETQQRAEDRIAEVRNDAGYDAQLATEFPEIKADFDRVAAGKPAETPVYIRTAEIYRAAIIDDPRLKGSKSMLLLAARAAKAQLKAEAKAEPQKVTDISEGTDGNRQQRRRDRIATQAHDKGAGGGEGGEDDNVQSITPQQKQILANLKVSEADFRKNRDISRSGR